MSFSIVGVPSSLRAPGTWAELLFNQGATSAPAGERYALYVGVMSSAGTATANTVYLIGDENQASTLFGIGSPLHRQLRVHLKANPTGRVYAMGYNETSTATNAPATATLTASGTITAAGSGLVSVCEEDINFSWTSSDTPTTVGDLLEARINGLTHLPLTASNAAGTVTLTSKVDGTSQNGIYRIRVKELTAGTGLALAASAETLGSGAEGTTTEAANLTTALAVADNQRYYYMSIASPIQAHITLLKTHLTTKSDPKPGLRSVGVVGSVGTLSATQTIAIAMNEHRLAIAWQKNSDFEPGVLAAQCLALYQKYEQGAFRFFRNFDLYSGSDWFIPKAYNVADRPSADDVDDAITDGITPINSNDIRSWMVFAATTRSKDSTGVLDDWRSLERHRVSIMDGVTDTVITNDRLTFDGFALMDDPRNADGTINLSARIPERTTTPSRYKAWLLNQMQPFFDAGALQRRDDWEASTDTRIDPLNNGRLQTRSSGRTIDLKHQSTIRFSETTPN